MPDYPSLDQFARDVLGLTLYPYQQRVGEAILDSVLHQRGLTFTVMFARQMGKNQLSAILEAYLLYYNQEGSIVKAAPTFRPQIINSQLRLQALLNNSPKAQQIWRNHGYIIGLAPSKEVRAAQVGPRVLFFSASPQSSIVGATASLLLEIDEAQDVDIDKYNRDLRPMASTTNATTVLYGTAWTDTTLLAITAADNLRLQEQDNIQRHFAYNWRTLAAFNPRYATFVQHEIERLGADHPDIRTQYLLQQISNAGRLFNALHLHKLAGSHDWCDEPEEDAFYVAGMDIGGEEYSHLTLDSAHAGAPLDTGRHDSTVITIGKVTYYNSMPRIQVVHHCWWTGLNYSAQLEGTLAVCKGWNIHHLVVDRTGLGDPLCSMLRQRLPPGCVIPYVFSRQSKSKLVFGLLSMINSDNLQLYRAQSGDELVHDTLAECMRQLQRARYRTHPNDQLEAYVDPADGHDDFLMSLALCCEATRDLSTPISENAIITPKHEYSDESPY
jgi:hypothetical protein